MNHYGKIVERATGVTDSNTQGLILEVMRNDIFHSPLDWQTAAQLSRAAKKAHRLLVEAECITPTRKEP